MSDNRLTVFPIKHQKLWDLYKKQLACFWKAEEIDFSKDRHDFDCLSENEQTFIKKILAFFSFADGMINANLEERFIKELVKHLLDYLKNLICITEVVPQDLYILSDIHLLKIIILLTHPCQ